jgi:hypothetical protein
MDLILSRIGPTAWCALPAQSAAMLLAFLSYVNRVRAVLVLPRVVALVTPEVMRTGQVWPRYAFKLI